MRVALVCPYALDAPGGVQVHITQLATRLIDRGHEVMVLGPSKTPPTQPWVRTVGRPVGINYNSASAPIDPRPWSVRKVRRALKSFEPDVIHAHEPLTPSTSMWATLASDGVPVVGTFHSGATRSRIFDLSARLLARLARRVIVRIAVSRRAEEFVASRIGGYYEIVPNGVDTALFAAGSGSPAQLGDGTKLIFVGRLERRKGFADALAAFEQLALEDPELGLVVAGDGPDKNLVEDLAPDVRRRVRLLGTVPNEDLPGYLAACDVYVGPARGGESFGIVLVEAMAAGLPVVASHIPGYDEVVRDSVDGLLVPPADPGSLAKALKRVIEDRDLRNRLVSGGIERAAGFDWEPITDRIEDLYRRAIGSTEPRIR